MTKVFAALAAALLLAAASPARAAPPDLPNAALHPGWLNPDVSQANIHTTICVAGYSKSVRPEPVYTNGLKAKQLRDERYADANPRDYEEDHLVPLSLGGHPRDPRNLWPEHWDGEWGAHVKDRLELRLYKMVCARQAALPLATAQHDIAADWIDAYRKYCATTADCPAYAGD